jgi:hypothetical protein
LGNFNWSKSDIADFDGRGEPPVLDQINLISSCSSAGFLTIRTAVIRGATRDSPDGLLHSPAAGAAKPSRHRYLSMKFLQSSQADRSGHPSAQKKVLPFFGKL